MTARASDAGQQDVDPRAARRHRHDVDRGEEQQHDDRDPDQRQQVLAAPRGQAQLHRGLGEDGRPPGSPGALMRGPPTRSR